MEKILARLIDAHGGLKRWKKFQKVLATIRSGGILFNLVNIPEDPTPRQVTTWLHEEHSSVRPVGAPDRFADFTPNRIAVRTEGAFIGCSVAPMVFRMFLLNIESSTPISL